MGSELHLNDDMNLTSDQVLFSTLVQEIGLNLGQEHLRNFGVYEPRGGSRR